MSTGVFNAGNVLASYLKNAGLPDELGCLGRAFAVTWYDQGNMHAERIVGRIEGLHMSLSLSAFSVTSAALRTRAAFVYQLMYTSKEPGSGTWQLLSYDAFKGTLLLAPVVEFTLLD